MVFLDKNGACWSVPNPEVRMQCNWTMGRRKPETKMGEPMAAEQGASVHRVFPRPAE